MGKSADTKNGDRRRFRIGIRGWPGFVTVLVLVLIIGAIWWWLIRPGVFSGASGQIDFKRIPASEYRPPDVDRTRLSRYKSVFDEWQASAQKAGPLKWSSESDIPRRTVCADFLNEEGFGPPQRQIVSTMSEVLALCQKDLEDRPNGPYWWTIAYHGGELKPSQPLENGLLLPISIWDSKGQAPPPSLTPLDISRAFRIILATPFVEDPAMLKDGAQRLAITKNEKLALVEFLAMCRANLKPGRDTVQVFGCFLGGETLGDAQAPKPIDLVRNLAIFLPGVRIVVYPGKVAWRGTSGDHKGARRLVFEWSP